MGRVPLCVCNIGFLHNGYGSGDVGIRLNFVPDWAIPEDATAVTVAGHDGFYRRIDDGWEEWSFDIGGTTVFINLEAESGTSEADIADAHALIRSMRTEPSDKRVQAGLHAHERRLGFRIAARR